MKKWITLFLVALMLVVFSAPVFAHEGRIVGNYEIVFGWRVEPTYVGVFNGPEITITNHETEAPRRDAEETLMLTVQFGPQSLPLRLEPVANEPGHYTADLIPTLPGDYTFILTGTLGDLVVNETFTSADGEFSAVEPATDILFPALEADSARIDELQAQIDALRAELEALRAAAGS
ncbi:MAG: hypothetical protein IPO91_18275 [Chloroflexi bacterium]|nr:hypothetical protein [Chloroflexota bacterium]